MGGWNFKELRKEKGRLKMTRRQELRMSRRIGIFWFILIGMNRERECMCMIFGLIFLVI